MKLPLAHVFVLSLVFSVACAGRAAAPPPRSAAEEQQDDGRLPVPPPPTKKGIIVPSDVGPGPHPGTTPTAGTNDNGLGSPIGPAH
jgi:hypothetical protein